ncbi:MAG TPA: OmpA family protein [Elusimicrobiota bacterium]|nr:OmpA family protein [Elusimicrobiota bacterium]
MQTNAIFSKIGLFLLASAVLTGCPPKKKPIVPVEPPVAEAPVEEPGIDVGEEWVSAPNLPLIYFETNKSDLTADARAVLKKNAPVLKAILAEASGVQVRVEGHCDERNTLEYNLALGERRAAAVKDYYVSLGVAKTALSTVSFGEERPVCSLSEEGCWSKNRRAATVLKSSSGPIRIPFSKLPAAE